MTRFRKKPVEVEAFQFNWRDGDQPPDIPGVVYAAIYGKDSGHLLPKCERAYVETLEGSLHVSRGDWVVRGINGEFYPVKPDIFSATYEPIDRPVPKPGEKR